MAPILLLTSFINQVENPDINLEKVIAYLINHLRNIEKLPTHYALPKDLYGKHRINSSGINLADPEVLIRLQQDLERLKTQTWLATPLVNGKLYTGSEHNIYNPANSHQLVGKVIYSNQKIVEEAITVASSASKHWRLSEVNKRASFLQKAAELLEKNRLELVALCVREAGKTIIDALAEIRDAIDYCRYYAQTGRP